VIRDYAWLIIGIVVAAAFAGFGLGARLATRLSELAPLPWAAFGMALLIFAAFAGVHFRLRLMQALDEQQAQLERGAAASRLIMSASADGRRWLRVVQENLELVCGGGAGERERDLYLGGALANAEKLDQAFTRIEGNQRQLDASNE
jgi:hypothetical protein